MILLKTGLFKHNSLPITRSSKLLHTCMFCRMKFFFHTQPRFTPSFYINLSQNKFCGGTAQYCSVLSPHSQYQSTDLNLLFHRIKIRPFFLLPGNWNGNAAILFNCSSVRTEKNLVAYTMQDTRNVDKPLQKDSLLLHRNIKTKKLFLFPINWIHVLMVLLTLLASLRVSRLNF